MTMKLKRRVLAKRATALLAVASVSSVHAMDDDCKAPDGSPYSGFSLQTGTGCSTYVNCANGSISGIPQNCPTGLLFNGAVGEGGICDWEAAVTCRDPALTASQGGSPPAQAQTQQTAQQTQVVQPPPNSSAAEAQGPSRAEQVQAVMNAINSNDLNADCKPAGNPTYTGYSLKTGTGCAQYVNCQNGVISGWLTCTNGLKYDGGIGLPGICNHPAQVSCAEESAAANGAAAAMTQQTQPQAQAAAPATTLDPDQAAQVEAVKNSINSNDDNADCKPAGNPYYTGYTLKTGTGCSQYVFCQSGVISGWQTCTNGLKYNGGIGLPGICNHPDQVFCAEESAAFAAAESAAYDAANAAASGAPPAPMTPSASSAQTAANAASSNSNGNDNPDNYFCGSDIIDAASRCIPCPDNELQTCAAKTGDYSHGCFRNVMGCSSGSSLNDVIAEMMGGGFDFNQQDQQQPVPQGQQAAVPAPTPTLPPYTSPPFVPSPGLSQSKTVIGYYAGWQWYDRNKFADPNNIDFTKYNRINYAFFQPDAMGNLFGTDEWGDPKVLWGPEETDAMKFTPANYKCSWDGPLVKNCAYHQKERGLIQLAKAAGAEVMPSIGGWTLSDNFPGIAASASKRENFAQQCVDLIKEYDFDGIDIDWEYPGYEDHSGTPADTENFTLLLRAVRDKLIQLGYETGKNYGLTAALPCGPDKIEKIQVNQIKDILTELNLMSYDMHGAWDTLTGTNAPMFDQGWGDPTEGWSTHGCVNKYVELGVPLQQMNIGLPFYGRSVTGATGMKQFHGGADDINYHLDEGSPQYFNIVNELGRMKTYRHEKTQTQYAVFNNGGGLVSYDDPRAICDKVDYANKRGMHGFLIWEISGDMLELPDGTVYTPLIDATNRKIQQPGYDCDSLRDPVTNLDYNIAPPEPATVDWSLYQGPASTGSANDFSGAQASSWSAPASDSSWNNDNQSQNNMVYISSPSNTGGASSGSGNNDCPQGSDGYYPGPGCTTYVFCQGGSVLGASMPCVPGTLFNKDISVCTFPSTFNCED